MSKQEKYLYQNHICSHYEHSFNMKYKAEKDLSKLSVICPKYKQKIVFLNQNNK